MTPPVRPPRPPPAKIATPPDLASALGTRLRDPYRDLADQRGRPLFGPAHASPPQTRDLLAADIAGLRLLADLAFKEGRYADAATHLAAALNLAPGHAPTRHSYAVALFRQGQEARAIPEVERLLAADPRNPAYRTLLASSLAMTGDFAGAVRLYEALVRDAPAQPDLWLSHAQALRHVGKPAEAIRAFRRCLEHAPDTGTAFVSLAGLDALAEPDLAAMRRHLADTALSAENRAGMHYALGEVLEKSGSYAESFSHYAQGARARRATLPYSAEATSAAVRQAMRIFTPARLAACAGAGCPDSAPIFIVGMPRAGSTLIEQILASHSAIEGTLELPELGHIVGELEAEGGLAGVRPERLAALGQCFIARTRIYRRTEKPMFIDKMPGNFLYAGLIHMMLPNARIIDVRRDPMANGFGAFRKYFDAGQNFSYDLTDIGRYITDYLALMAHFDSVLPGRIHLVRYESIVADTEAEIRRLLAYCGLDFEPACLRFWQSDRAVSTVSSHQVRRPIYREGLESWRRYEPWLGELRAALPGS